MFENRKTRKVYYWWYWWFDKIIDIKWVVINNIRLYLNQCKQPSSDVPAKLVLLVYSCTHAWLFIIFLHVGLGGRTRTLWYLLLVFLILQYFLQWTFFLNFWWVIKILVCRIVKTVVSPMVNPVVVVYCILKLSKGRTAWTVWSCLHFTSTVSNWSEIGFILIWRVICGFLFVYGLVFIVWSTIYWMAWQFMNRSWRFILPTLIYFSNSVIYQLSVLF